MKCRSCGAPLERASPELADTLGGSIRTQCVFLPCEYCCDDETTWRREAVWKLRREMLIERLGYQQLYSMNGGPRK